MSIGKNIFPDFLINKATKKMLYNVLIKNWFYKSMIIKKISLLILGTQRSTKNNHVDIHFNSKGKIYENYTENYPRRTIIILIHKLKVNLKPWFLTYLKK